jgi:Asp-tRNA(Asn)/Glu-tRNA(Gln) amidotransferase A subunit family amidase
MGEGWGGFATNGPIARSVRDAAALLDVMSGAAEGDPYSAPPPRHRFVDALKLRLRGLRLAVISETSLCAIDAEIAAAFEEACGVFRAMGHQIEPIVIDPAAMLREIAEKLICAGIGSIPIKQPQLMDPIVRALWERGRRIGAHEYIATLARMHNVSRELVQSLSPYDALLTPTIPRPAMAHGTLYSTPESSLNDTFGWIAFTFPFNATGQPALSIPNGMTRDGLPIGLQIVGRPADEIGIIALAAAFEEACPWRGRHPALD